MLVRILPTIPHIKGFCLFAEVGRVGSNRTFTTSNFFVLKKIFDEHF